jgi:sigma-54 specific flagellar transcriptional regulator A
VFTPIGAVKSRIADVRFIAATNRDLPKDVEQGKFRADLYFRLNAFGLTIPPLRERSEDVPLLVEHFRERISASGKQAPVFSKEAVAALVRYRWPGNVRELQNIVDRVTVMHSGKLIEPSLLGDRFRDSMRGSSAGDKALTPPPPPSPAPSRSLTGEQAPVRPTTASNAALDDEPINFKEKLRLYEVSMIKKALAISNGNQTRAAKELGINRTTLIEKMRKHGIESKDEGESGEPADD